MKKTLFRLIAIVMVLAFSAPVVFADESSSTYLEIIEQIKTAQQEYEESLELINAKLEMAYELFDAEKYIEARNELKELKKPEITKEQSQLIENGIISNSDTESAKWLFSYSPYYRPVLTLSYQKDGFRYSSNTIVIPGSEITLPSMTPPSKNLVFQGWGTTETQTSYMAGETIPMPLTNTTLYAVFISKEGLEEGKNISISKFTVDENEIAEENVETIEIPRRKIFDFSFSLTNNGTVNLPNVEVTFDSEDPLLVVLSETLSAKWFESGDQKIAKFQVITKAPSGTEMTGTITVKDNDGQTWTFDKVFKVK